MTPEQQAKLRRSIEEFGCVQPIVINERSGRVVGGHQRLTALLELGESEAACAVVNLDDDHERALALALNKIHGSFDEEKLRAVLEEFSAEFDTTLSGFDLEEIHALLDKNIEAQQDDFDVESALEQAEPVTKPGDLWKLGEHRLICGDSTDRLAIDRLVGSERAQLLLTDPPYNVNVCKKAGSITNDNMSCADFYAFLLAAFKVATQSLAPGAAAYIFHADSESIGFRNAFADAGFHLAETLVWVKNHFVLGHMDYHMRHEPVLYGWLPGAAHYFAPERIHSTVLEPRLRPDLGKLKKQELRDLAEKLLAERETVPQSALRADKPISSAEHPTMKPVPLLGQLLKNSSKPSWLVLDPFAGSGGTLIACEQLGRRAFCCELEPRFCDVIIGRWEAATGRKAEKIE